MKFQHLLPFCILFFIILVFEACSKKHYICPAYNSYFIHDRLVRDSRFSPFVSDSTNNNLEEMVINSDSSSGFLVNKVENEGSSTLGTGKFQPKFQPNNPKKFQPNGLLAASNGKGKIVRAVEEIEMKIIMIKPISRYSNVDSSSIKKTDGDIDKTVSDTL